MTDSWTGVVDDKGEVVRLEVSDDRDIAVVCDRLDSLTGEFVAIPPGPGFFKAAGIE